MDYTTSALLFQLENTRELNAILFDQMEQESDFMMSCLENMQIVVEAEVQNSGAKRNVFQKIIDFIKKIMGVFTDKAKALFSGSEEWMKANFPRLDKIDYDGLEIEMVPFWSFDLKSQIKATMLFFKNAGKVNDFEKYKDREVFLKEKFGKYLDENDELANGLKNFFRVGKSTGPIKPVKLQGSALKSKVQNDFRDYCMSYRSVMVPTMEATVKELETYAKMIDSTLSKRGVKEAFCLVENAYYSETELAVCENYSILMEADEPEKPEEKKPEPSSSDKPASPSKVQLTDHGSKDKAEGQAKMDKASSAELLVAKNSMYALQLMLTSSMSVSEEKFHAYLGAIKQILSARGKATKEEKK